MRMRIEIAMTRRGLTSIAIVVAAASVWASASQQPRVSEITVAHNVARGQPVDPATVLTPDAGEIFVWARLTGAIPGTVIRSAWFYLGGTAPLAIADADVTVTPGATTVNFSFALPAGRKWPEGGYRVELSAGGRVLGEARFAIAVPTRYTHPRAGYAFTPPAGWTIEDAGPGDGVRLHAPGGDGLIEFASGLTGARLDPVSYAAGWQSVAVGPGKLLETKRSGGTSTLDGETSYEAVYVGKGVLSKIVFACTADRMFVISASFGADVFAPGESILARLLETVTLTSRAAARHPRHLHDLQSSKATPNGVTTAR
jgi:hypothetical protein